MNNSLYDNLREIIVQYIFGGQELTANQDLITELVCMGGVLLLVALPFTLVIGLIKLVLSTIK